MTQWPDPPHGRTIRPGVRARAGVGGVQREAVGPTHFNKFSMVVYDLPLIIRIFSLTILVIVLESTSKVHFDQIVEIIILVV